MAGEGHVLVGGGFSAPTLIGKGTWMTNLSQMTSASTVAQG